MNGSFVPNDEPLYTCEERLPSSTEQVLMFLPVYDGAVNSDMPHATFTGKCWDFDVTYEQTDPSSFDLVINTSNKQQAVCADNLFIANTEIKHIESFWFGGEHRITLNVPDNGQVDLAFGGIKMFHFCGSWVEEIESVFHTLEAFVGGVSDHPLIPFVGSHTPPYMEKANIGFIEAGMGITIEERPIYEVDLPENYIQSGDFFVIMRLDGLDPMIMYGTGSRGAHCVMALWFDDGLFIVESQDAWYWPTAGIQRTPYATWIKQAKEASFNVIHLPMSLAAEAKFDETKA